METNAPNEPNRPCPLPYQRDYRPLAGGLLLPGLRNFSPLAFLTRTSYILCIDHLSHLPISGSSQCQSGLSKNFFSALTRGFSQKKHITRFKVYLYESFSFFKDSKQPLPITVLATKNTGFETKN
jgi:hypothetical protein